jgi:hypothetical protein
MTASAGKEARDPEEVVQARRSRPHHTREEGEHQNERMIQVTAVSKVSFRHFLKYETTRWIADAAKSTFARRTIPSATQKFFVFIAPSFHLFIYLICPDHLVEDKEMAARRMSSEWKKKGPGRRINYYPN